MTKLKVLSVLVLIILGAVLIIQNTESVETRFLFFTLSMPRAVLLLITTMIGLLTGLTLGLWLAWRNPKSKVDPTK